MEEREPLQTSITVLENYGRGIPNLMIFGARFYGRPNFSGEPNQWKDSRRQFTIMIPNEDAENLRVIGYNVKTKVLTPEEIAEGREVVSHLNIKVDFRPDKMYPDDITRERGPTIVIHQDINGIPENEPLTSRTVGALDRARFENIDMEIRGWEYDAEENPGQYSARLVQLVAVMRPNMLTEKYGRF